MSTRLIQVVSFANVASGGTTALPHNININDVAKKPDFVASDNAGFTIVVTATQVSVTNNNAAPANVNVWLELKHSIPRELGALTNLTPQPFVAAAGSGGSPPAVFVWHVGTTWAQLYPQLAAVSGPKIVLVEWDEATTGVRTLTADAGFGVGTPQNLNQVWFVGIGGNSNTPIISVQDGAKLASIVQTTLNIARLSSKSVNWDFTNLTVPMFDSTNPGDFAIFAFELGDASGCTAPGVAVVQGALQLLLWSSNVSDILCNQIDNRSSAQMQGRCTLSTGFRNSGPPGTLLSISSDATCYIDPQLQIDFPGSPRVVATFAKNNAGDLFNITVDGGGNVIATPVI